MKHHRATYLHVAPPMILALADLIGAADLSSVRHVVSGAAPLDATTVATTATAFGCTVGQGYGMTEASPGIHFVPDDDVGSCPPGSVGRLVAGTEARLVDPVTGSDVEAEGELWVRGPQVMAAYLGAAEATAETIVEDGWLRTGDLLRVDGSGAWTVVDRLKELIKYKGYQVAPAELEAVLMTHPFVIDAAVVGTPQRSGGEVPVAFVVVAVGLVAGADELIAWVSARVAPYKKIRAVEVVSEIPRSTAGKILRRELRDAAARSLAERTAGPEPGPASEATPARKTTLPTV